MPIISRIDVDPPNASTFAVMAGASRRAGLPPWSTMDALQALYVGQWGREGSTPPRGDPIDPIAIDSDGGHPPVTPLDRAAEPDVMDALLDDVERVVYRLVWDMWRAREAGRWSHASARLDCTVIGPTAAAGPLRGGRVVFEALEVGDGDALAEALTEPPALLRRNRVGEVAAAWSSLASARLEARTYPAGHWRMTYATLIDRLAERRIGRPSTLADSLCSLVSRELLIEENGILKLTMAGFNAARLLEHRAGALSDPSFSRRLQEARERVAKGAAPAEVLMELGPTLAPNIFEHIGPDERAALASRIWTNPDDLALQTILETRALPVSLISEPQDSLIDDSVSFD